MTELWVFGSYLKHVESPKSLPCLNLKTGYYAQTTSVRPSEQFLKNILYAYTYTQIISVLCLELHM